MANIAVHVTEFCPSESVEKLMLRSAIKFARVRIIATCFALVFLGSAAGGAISPYTIFAILPMIAFTIHANSINDLSDYTIDKINLKNASDRPLVSNDLNRMQFWILHLMSGVVMILLSLLYGREALILTLAVLAIDYAYSLQPLRITNRTFLSPAVLAITYTYYSFSIGYWAADSTNAYPWLLTIGLCFGFIARLLLKDFRDIKGDKQHGKITFLVKYGAKTTTITSGLFWLLSMFLVTIALSFGISLLVILTFGAFVVCIWLYHLARTTDQSKQQKYVKNIAKFANIAILVILTYLLASAEDAANTDTVTMLVGVTLMAFSLLFILGEGNRLKR